MKIRAERGDIVQQKVDAIIVNLFEGVTSPGGATGAVDQALDDDGELIGVHDVYRQAGQVLRNIEVALQEAGASLADVVRTRIYLTNIDHWKRVAEAHSEAFGDVRPASTLIEVSRFVDPRMLIEIDADAYVGEAEAQA